MKNNIAIICNSNYFINKDLEKFADIYVLSLTKGQKNFAIKNALKNIFGNIYTCIIDYQSNCSNNFFFYKSQNQLFNTLADSDYQYIILLNCLSIITPKNIIKVKNKLFNIHPSYLPYFPGRNYE